MKSLANIFALIALLLLVVGYITEPKKRRTEEVNLTDTIVVTKIDTIVFEKPILKERTIIDTFYVAVKADSVKTNTKKDTVYVKLEREQLHYSEKGVYDAWISGFKPRIDSFYVYPKTYTKTVEKLVRSEKMNVFATGEVGMNKKEPFVGVGLTATKKQYLFGGMVGVSSNGLYYGVKVGIKLNEK